VNEDFAILEYVCDKAERDLDRAVDIWSDFEPEGWGAAARRLQQSGLLEMASMAGDYKGFASRVGAVALRLLS
jgi:hypothetical protein